ncbi:unnamed protein product [Acanthosepion pharaonis]|uniref:Uncharacterized protein n=1 Tax=Acanthosepion pharaonis TaxID=158019 RepID=A0A812DFV1_ACAPH|nr:unnamed protein product [Sepia pharaonis]
MPVPPEPPPRRRPAQPVPRGNRSSSNCARHQFAPCHFRAPISRLLYAFNIDSGSRARHKRCGRASPKARAFFRRIINSKAGVIDLHRAGRHRDRPLPPVTCPISRDGRRPDRLGPWGKSAARRTRSPPIAREQPTSTWRSSSPPAGSGRVAARSDRPVARTVWQGPWYGRLPADWSMVRSPRSWRSAAPMASFDPALYQQLLAQRKMTDAQVRTDLQRTLFTQQLTVRPSVPRRWRARWRCLYASLLLESGRRGRLHPDPSGQCRQRTERCGYPDLLQPQRPALYPARASRRALCAGHAVGDRGSVRADRRRDRSLLSDQRRVTPRPRSAT